MEEKKKTGIWIILGALALMAILCVVLMFFSELVTPSISGASVAILSAFIGVILTIGVTNILLERQSETEKEKDKDVKIYEKKIAIFSIFIGKMWDMIDDGKIEKKELEDLRKICFNQVVFYLNSDSVKKVTDELIVIRESLKDNSDCNDTIIDGIAKITNVLQVALNSKNQSNEIKSGELQTLFHSFLPNDDKVIDDIESEEIIPVNNSMDNVFKGHFWHFNMLGEKEQLKTFEDGNWILNLIEYGEDWRTETLKRVKIGDIVFLFRRGGAGYVGAFIVKGKHITEVKSNNFSDIDRQYDIYDAIEDGATLVSSLEVRPLAFKWKGIGYPTVRRRTIEIMNSGYDWLIDNFSKIEQNILPSGKPLEINDADKDLFGKLCEKYKGKGN